MAEPATRLTLEQVREILESSPARLAQATAGSGPAALLQPLEAGGWSARDILGHIRSCNRTWGGYIVRILDEDNPSFPAENPRTTIRGTDFLDIPFADSLAGFTAERDALLGRLRAAASDDLARAARVRLPGMGVQDRSAFHYAHRMAEHERQHVRHIERAMA